MCILGRIMDGDLADILKMVVKKILSSEDALAVAGERTIRLSFFQCPDGQNVIQKALLPSRGWRPHLHFR